MKTFVINLKRSPDRREFMEAQSKQLGVDFEFIAATDGKELTDEEFQKIHDTSLSTKHLWQPLTRNEVACANSHLRVYEEIVARNLPYALVLEDDAVVDPRLIPLLEDTTFLNQKPFDWLQIDYARVGIPFLQGWVHGSLIYIKKKPLFLFYVLLKLPYILIISLFEWLREQIHKKSPQIVSFGRPLYLASAYIITNEGAKKLIKFGRPIRFACDMLPNKARIKAGFRMRAVSPPLAHQNSSFESVTGVR